MIKSQVDIKDRIKSVEEELERIQGEWGVGEYEYEEVFRMGSEQAYDIGKFEVLTELLEVLKIYANLKKKLGLLAV